MSARPTEHTPATTRWRVAAPDLPAPGTGRPQGWRVPVVALIGIDGAGKTTQARRLAGWLAAAGVPADHWPNPGGRRALDRLARRLGQPDAAGLLGPNGLLTIEALARWLALARALTWSQLRGRVAVMDRYSYCQYANIRARGASGETFARLIFAAFPRPDLVCHLLVPPTEAHRRIETRGTDREDPSYLAATHRAYLALPEALGFVPVDATGDPERVAARLRRVVTARLLAANPARPAAGAPGQLRSHTPRGILVPDGEEPCDHEHCPGPTAPGHHLHHTNLFLVPPGQDVPEAEPGPLPRGGRQPGPRRRP